MSELTYLSDAELDAVNGGRFSIGFSFNTIQTNIAQVEQSQTNVNVLTSKSRAGGSQSVDIDQRNHA